MSTAKALAIVDDHPVIKKKRRRIWPWFLLLALVGGGVFAYLKRGAATGKEIDPALLISVKRADLAIDVIETGKVQPREKVEVKSKVAGQVERVYVEEGQHVKKGQLMLRLDPTDYRRDVEKCEADVLQAKNSLEFARLSLDRRVSGLASRGVAQADVDVAQNELKVRTVAVRLAAVALGAAEDRLKYTELSSPMDGTIIERGIQPGEVVTPGVQATFEGKALLTVADLSTLLVKADLNQIDVAKVRMGQTVTLTLDALPGKKYEATITKIAPASTLPKGKDVEVFPVEATLITTDEQIKPGMTADVRIHIETKKQVLSLPIEAVAKEAGKTFATRVSPSLGKKSVTEKIEVTVGAKNDRELEITTGLREGDEVLIKPASSAENEYK